MRAIVPVSRPMRLAWEQVAAPRSVDRWGVDVYHGPHYTMPELAKTPKVVTVHDLTFFDHPEWHEKVKVALFTRAIRAAAELAAEIICDSQVTADRLKELVQTRCPVSVVHLGVDHDIFRPLADAEDDLRLLDDLGIRPPFVGYVGTFEPRKGVDVLVRAFGQIAADHPEVELVLAGGSGWGEEVITGALDASAVRDRIVRPGYLTGRAVLAVPTGRRGGVSVVGGGLRAPARSAFCPWRLTADDRAARYGRGGGDAAVLVPGGDADVGGRPRPRARRRPSGVSPAPA